MMTFDYGPGNGKTGFAADMFKMRFWRLRLSQSAFAKRFGLTCGTVQNCEQERHKPTPAMRVLIAAIDLDPAFMEMAAKSARERWG